MYPRCSPRWVVSDHTKDQLANLLRRPSSSNLPPNFGDQPPVHTKTSPVPAHDGLRRDDDESLLPSGPEASSGDPKEFIEQPYARTAMSTFQYSELLAQHEILQHKIPAATEKANQGSDAEEKQAEHGRQLCQINDRNVVSSCLCSRPEFWRGTSCYEYSVLDLYWCSLFRSERRRWRRPSSRLLACRCHIGVM